MIAAMPGRRNSSRLHYGEPMSRHTSWRIGGCADVFFRPSSVAELTDFIAGLDEDEDILWIGLGSNLLVRDGGVRGVGDLHAGPDFTHQAIGQWPGSCRLGRALRGARPPMYALATGSRGVLRRNSRYRRRCSRHERGAPSAAKPGTRWSPSRPWIEGDGSEPGAGRTIVWVIARSRVSPASGFWPPRWHCPTTRRPI